MNAHEFSAALRQLRAIPGELREKFLALAQNLPEGEHEKILTHVSALDADLRRNEAKYAASAKRSAAMLQQVEQNDLPAFDKLSDA